MEKRIGPVGEMQQWNRTLVPTSANATWDFLLFLYCLIEILEAVIVFHNFYSSSPDEALAF